MSDIVQTGAETRGKTVPGRLGLRIHVGLLALLPMFLLVPTQGTMLIVPLAPTTEAASLVWATRAGARMIGPGPLRGSVLIDASPSQLWPAALSHGALLVRSEGAGCVSTVE